MSKAGRPSIGYTSEDDSKIRERVFKVNQYEDLKVRKRGAKTNEYFVNIEGEYKYYTLSEIVDITKIELNKKQLERRFRNLLLKNGNFFTIKDTIFFKKTKKKNKLPPEKLNFKKNKLEKAQREMDFFNKYMKLIKPGSLHNQAKIIQCNMSGDIK